VVVKALVCRNCNARSREPRGLQIGRTSSGSDPTLGSRTYEATQAPWLPSGRSPSRGCERAGSLGRRRRSGPGLQTRLARATTTEGARAHASRRGARNPPEATPPKAAMLPGLRALHSAVTRPMLPGSARNRAPSLHRGGRHRTYRPRRESGDAPARGTRRGSTDGMAPRRHLTTFTGRARSPKKGAGRTHPGSKRPAGGRTRWRAPWIRARASGQTA
jgi:hypothetical protein